jgi:hypothetical protein
MTNHTELLNLIADVIGAKRYLEIGVFNPDHNFNHIKVPDKFGVDPDPKSGATFKWTSDECFKYLKVLGGKMDLIFIDGLHHADQVEKDIQNAWDCLNIGGVIVLHDCNPPTEATTCVPRGTQREWCGDVYKTVSRVNFKKFTMDFDYGCCVIRKTDYYSLDWLSGDVDWEVFENNRKYLLDLVSVQEGINIIKSWYKILAPC